MTLQNRVLPTGEIVADPDYRGGLMGNRGILHDEDRRLGPARWKHKAWIACVLDFKGRRRVPMTPGRYTELFFLDEAVALAAGHRPCAECRRADFRLFRAAWEGAHGGPCAARDIDAALHGARVARDRRQVRHVASAADLPDGTFVLVDGRAHLVFGDGVRVFGTQRYGPPRQCPTGDITVLTPAPTVAALRAGYRPGVHSSVGTGEHG